MNCIIVAICQFLDFFILFLLLRNKGCVAPSLYIIVTKHNENGTPSPPKPLRNYWMAPNEGISSRFNDFLQMACNTLKRYIRVRRFFSDKKSRSIYTSIWTACTLLYHFYKIAQKFLTSLATKVRSFQNCIHLYF